MANFIQGDIIFVPFPFSEKTESKQRPAVIISNNSPSDPLYVVAKITSVIRNEKYSFLIDDDNYVTVDLRKLSEVRTMELFTIHKTAIIQKISSFTDEAIAIILDKVGVNLSK